MASPSAPSPVLRARVPALVAASLVLGTAAHVGASGAVLTLGPFLVTAALLVMLVTALVGMGRWAARGVRGAAAAHVQDAAALVALVLGQALVHLSVGAVAPGGGSTAGHVHHHGSQLADGSLAGPGMLHGSSAGMLASHALAALVVGLLLRWLERGVLALFALSGSCARAACGRLFPPLAAGIIPTPRRRRSVTPRADWDLRPHLCLGLGAVVRRGPPMALA